MGKRERGLRRKELEDPEPRVPAPSPSSRGAPNKAREVTAERLLVGTDALRDWQDETTGAMEGEEP